MKHYRNLQLWDGISDALRSAELLVAEGKFADGGAGDAETEDLQGCVVIPGLIDAHIHLCLDPDVRDPLAHGRLAAEEQLAAMRVRAEGMLLAGITTARDLGGGAWLELQVRDEIARGEHPGPRLLCAGQPITSVGGHCHFWQGEAADLPEAMEVLQRQCEHGTDLIKIMVTGGNITPGSKPVDSQFDDDLVSGVVAAAAARDLTVAAHCHGTNGIRQAAAAGVRTVEHCSWVGEAGWGRALDERVVATLAQNDVYVSPTINAGWKRYRNEEFVSLVQRNYRHMKQAGVKLIASTDAGIPGVYHRDLPRALPEFARFAGLSPVEVLKSATSVCAAAIGIGEVAGTIAPGYSADFVVYEKNPLEDLAVLENPLLVVSRGREFDTAA